MKGAATDLPGYFLERGGILEIFGENGAGLVRQLAPGSFGPGDVFFCTGGREEFAGEDFAEAALQPEAAGGARRTGCFHRAQEVLGFSLKGAGPQEAVLFFSFQEIAEFRVDGVLLFGFEKIFQPGRVDFNRHEKMPLSRDPVGIPFRDCSKPGGLAWTERGGLVWDFQCAFEIQAQFEATRVQALGD